PAEEFVGKMAANGIDRAVLVQAMGAYTDDNRYCVDSANGDPGRLTAVVYLDLSDPADDPGAVLATWARNGATGVRVVAGTEHTPEVTAPVVASLVEAAVELDVRVLLTIPAPAL